MTVKVQHGDYVAVVENFGCCAVHALKEVSNVCKVECMMEPSSLV